MIDQVTPLGSSNGRRNKFIFFFTCFQIYTQELFYTTSPLDTTNALAQKGVWMELLPKFQFSLTHNGEVNEYLLWLNLLDNRVVGRSWISRINS